MYCSRIASLGFLLACVACNGGSVFPCLVSFVVMVKGDSNKSSDQQDVPNTDNRLSNMESQIMMLMSMVSDMKAQLSNQHSGHQFPQERLYWREHIRLNCLLFYHIVGMPKKHLLGEALSSRIFNSSPVILT